MKHTYFWSEFAKRKKGQVLLCIINYLPFDLDNSQRLVQVQTFDLGYYYYAVSLSFLPAYYIRGQEIQSYAKSFFGPYPVPSRANRKLCIVAMIDGRRRSKKDPQYGQQKRIAQNCKNRWIHHAIGIHLPTSLCKQPPIAMCVQKLSNTRHGRPHELQNVACDSKPVSYTLVWLPAALPEVHCHVAIIGGCGIELERMHQKEYMDGGCD